MAVKSICFVANGYPTKDNPEYAFIRPVVCALADQGIECSVIVPQSITTMLFRKKKARSKMWFDTTDCGKTISIFQPYFFSTSNKKILGINIGIFSKISAIRKVMKQYKVMPDVMYGHFWQSAILAAAATKNRIPVIAVSGESLIWVREIFTDEIIEKYLPAIKGVIAVSTKNLEESKKLRLILNSMKTVVLPNAISASEFYKIEKDEARTKLGLNKGDIIAVFVGSFCERKGTLRVVEAAMGIERLKLMFIGKGEQKPESEQVVFCGSLPHDEIVTYLNAADMFVLPTRAEGCCNAIVEALNCGLPIISSDLPFNEDILNERNSILVHPDDINEIHGAMEKLATNNQLREQMACNAEKSAQELKIDVRCKKILDFINECVN